MKTLLLASAIAGIALLDIVFQPVVAQPTQLQSLRGAAAVDQNPKPPELNYWQRDRPPIARDYVQQPPLIPHAIEGYQISRNFNKCLSCHSWSNYSESGATKISQTHFEDRDRQVRANIAGTRYFCTQCHVPQTEAQPLVGNTFQPLEVIRQQ